MSAPRCYNVSLLLRLSLLLSVGFIAVPVRCRTECDANGGGVYYCPKDGQAADFDHCCSLSDEPDSCCSPSLAGWAVAVIIVCGFIVTLGIALAVCCLCGWRMGGRRNGERLTVIRVPQAQTSYGTLAEQV
eukprot:scpid85723/ scgid26263/ 